MENVETADGCEAGRCHCEFSLRMAQKYISLTREYLALLHEDAGRGSQSVLRCSGRPRNFTMPAFTPEPPFRSLLGDPLKAQGFQEALNLL